jgi:hypothetical protein
MTDQASIKVDRSVKAELDAMGAPTMNAAIEQALHGASVSTRFAAASANTPETGVPAVAIPTINDPTLTMWQTMEKRIIKADHGMRISAAEDDVFRMLGSIIDACSIGLYSFSADDMDASAETIAEMKTWIRDTNLMTAFKGGGINSDDCGALYNYRVQGEYALWVGRSNKAGGTGKIESFINLPINGLRRMTNPQDPTKFYFFQKYDKIEDYTDPEAWDDVESERDTADIKSTEQRVWYIDGGEKSRDATDDVTKKPMYPKIRETDWVLPLENLVYIKNPAQPLNDFTVSAIAAKRYLVMMTPAAIQLGIIPFDLLTFGNEELRPPMVDEKIKETNPTEYDKQIKILEAYNASIQTIIHGLFDCSTSGKPFGIQWGVTHERFEPKMSLTADFIESVLMNLNQIIAFSVGIPLTIITSVGTELATSRLTMATTSHALLATQESFREVIMHLLRMQFDKEIVDQGIEISLQELDNTDQATKADIYTKVAQAANYLKSAGASSDTISQFINSVVDIPITHAVFDETLDDKSSDGEDDDVSDTPEKDDESSDDTDEEVL